jgi:Zn-dependent M28 family amino/carboxypeptidase
LRTPTSWAATAALTAAALAAPTQGALAAPSPSDNPSTQGFRKAVTLAGVREHQTALQKIADQNDGNRVAGSAGHDKSADYVQAKLEAAGYKVTRQTFTYTFTKDVTPPELQQISPNAKTYKANEDFASMTYSGSGNVTAPVTAVDLDFPPPATAGTSDSGCEAADFAGFPVGSIALMQRGTCNFGVKADNAIAAGAAGVIIFNEGQDGRTDVIAGTLGAPVRSVPVVGTSFAVGQELSGGTANGATGRTVRVKTDRFSEDRDTDNVIAETPGGDPNNVVVVGAHLDSVEAGPGINDNGSGSAGILEIAEQLQARDITPRNKVRFAWWSAEESGLVGSTEYVASLSEDELKKIKLNLNFDMIGSPNFVRFVYDGDNSAFPVGPNSADGPQGSGEIERVFHDYFKGVGQASSETPFSGRSDYGPFIEEGIPAGGLFTGAEGVKTAQEAAIYGGTAGAPYDPCYHQACDTFANNSNTGLDTMVDAAAHSVLYFAKRNFAKNPLVDPATPSRGSTSTPGGGGLHDDHAHDEVR